MKNVTKGLATALILSVFLFTSGCATQKAYKGAELPLSSTAELTVPRITDFCVRINKKAPSFGWKGTVFIPQGENNLNATYSPGKSAAYAVCGGGLIPALIIEGMIKDYKWDVTFTAAPGENYSLLTAEKPNGKITELVPYVIENNTRKVVSKTYRAD